MIEYWEKFKGGETKPPRERQHVTLNDKRLIMMNRKVFEMMGSPRAVELSYNATECRIGLDGTHPESNDAFRVLDQRGHYLIRTAPFCRHHGIRVEGTQKFTNIEIDQNLRLKLDLTTTVKVSRGPRRKTGRKGTPAA